MEEKKLTDEEIIKAFEYKKEQILGEVNRTGNAVDDLIYGIEAELVIGVIDFIQRLQAENEELKSPKFANWKVKFYNAKEEIERLTRESDEMFDRHAKENQAASILIEQRNNEIAELQKQVDELKEENKELYKENTTLIAGSILERKDIAKDTAKEILQEGKYCLSKSLQEWIKKRYGVEVE